MFGFLKNPHLRERNVFKQVRNALLLPVIFLAHCLFMETLLSLINRGDLMTFHFRYSSVSFATFFMHCLLPGLWEELAFRVAPLKIARGFGYSMMWPVIILSSTIFGWGHGNGPYSLLIQGVMGIGFCLLYIKNNYSYWPNVLAHASWNLFCNIAF